MLIDVTIGEYRLITNPQNTDIIRDFAAEHGYPELAEDLAQWARAAWLYELYELDDGRAWAEMIEEGGWEDEKII